MSLTLILVGLLSLYIGYCAGRDTYNMMFAEASRARRVGDEEIRSFLIISAILSLFAVCITFTGFRCILEFYGVVS